MNKAINYIHPGKIYRKQTRKFTFGKVYVIPIQTMIQWVNN